MAFRHKPIPNRPFGDTGSFVIGQFLKEVRHSAKTNFTAFFTANVSVDANKNARFRASVKCSVALRNVSILKKY